MLLTAERVGLALFELLVALAVVTAAVFAQGELVGRTLTAATAPGSTTCFTAAGTCFERRCGGGVRAIGGRGTPAMGGPVNLRLRCRDALPPVLDWLGEACCCCWQSWCW